MENFCICGKSECKVIKCYNTISCKNSIRLCVSDLYSGFCADCTAYLYIKNKKKTKNINF